MPPAARSTSSLLSPEMPGEFPTVPQVHQMRQRRRKAADSTRSRLGLGCSGALSLLAALGIILAAFTYASLAQGLPSLQTIPRLLEPTDGLLLTPTRLYDRTGQHTLYTLENPGALDRQYVYVNGSSSSSDTRTPVFPSSLVSATIAAADPVFLSGPGFSLAGLGETENRTLAEKLVASLVIPAEPTSPLDTLHRRLLAAQFTSMYGRLKIMEWYLNSSNYGRLNYGADAAARAYLGKPAADLTLAESALLAGVAEAPALNPHDAPQAALERQKLVLQAMVDRRLISPAQAQQARQETPQFIQPAAAQTSLPPELVSMILDQAGEQVGRARLERGGMRILTSLDQDLQNQAECALQAQLSQLAGQDSLEGTGAGCKTARLLPTLAESGVNLSPGLAATAAILDPRSGQLLALASSTQADRSVLRWPGRPAGSLLAPAVYLAAFTRGFGPASLLWDIPVTSQESSSNPGPQVENFDRIYHGPMRLRTALANDYRVPTASLLEQVGAANVWRMARQIGLLDPDQASALHSGILEDLENSRLTLLPAVQAFGVLANQGTLVGMPARQAPAQVFQDSYPRLDPVTVLRVEDDDGRLWYEAGQPAERPVVSPQLSYLLNNVLSDETARWASLGHSNPLEVGEQAAAKIGQTANDRDGWTVGYTPGLVVGTWLGEPEGSGTGLSNHPPQLNTAAAGLWHALMQYAAPSRPSAGWDIPPGVTTVDVCEPSGLLPTAECPTVINEYFLSGNEPTQTDTLFQPFQVNRETGKLATVFTSPELVEQRVYMVVPPQAADWAQQNGLVMPPDSYDVLSAASASPDVQIAWPQMFAHVRGQVPISGTAAGDNFFSYSIQVGEGLNPGSWIQVGQEEYTPVHNRLLQKWDTRGLDGLYAVQLLVVRQDQRVDQAIIQVTVDNQPPEVQFRRPEEGQVFSMEQTPLLSFQFDVSDNLGVQSLAIFLDGSPLTTLYQSPFVLPLNAVPGDHTLRVLATDLAGNQAQAETHYSVR